MLPVLVTLLGAVVSDHVRQQLADKRPDWRTERGRDWPEANFVPGGTFDPDQPHRLGDVFLWPERGIGAASDVANVNYMGFVAWMTPGEFLRLNPRREDEPDFVWSVLAEGYPVGPPVLYARVSDPAFHAWQEEGRGASPRVPTRLVVVGHEGRGRTAALARLYPGRLIPVSVLVQGEVRARDLTPALLLGAVLDPDPRGGAGPVRLRAVTLDRRNYQLSEVRR